MANSGFRLPRAGGPPAVKTGECPCVADLIDFAQGRIGPDDRRRIETHLTRNNCSHCQSWIAKAGGTSAGESGASQSAHLATADKSRSNSAAADRSSWQRLAFRDLEGRLSQLEEGS